MRRRVAVIGMGAVCAAGTSLGAFREALLEARSGIGPIEAFDTTGFPARVEGRVKGPFATWTPPSPWLGPGAREPAARNARLFAAAVGQALRGCGWLDERGRPAPPPGAPPPGARGLFAAIRDDEAIAPAEDDPLGPEADGSRAGEFPYRVARELELGGPHVALHDACSTGTALLGEALHDLREGDAEIAVVAAANADLSLETLCHYVLLSALASGAGPDACRPFDASRDGFVRAEGAACLVLRAWEPEREPPPGGAIAELAGAGSSADGWRPTAGHPEERGLVLALEACLEDAGCTAAQVEHVNAHGTGTRVNDMHEACAIHRVLGARTATVPLTATKAITGHASFASGLLEAVASAIALRDGTVPPTAHYTTPDPEMPPLDVVTGAPRACGPATVLSISSAFFGLNAAVLLKRL